MNFTGLWMTSIQRSAILVNDENRNLETITTNLVILHFNLNQDLFLLRAISLLCTTFLLSAIYICLLGNFTLLLLPSMSCECQFFQAFFLHYVSYLGKFCKPDLIQKMEDLTDIYLPMNLNNSYSQSNTWINNALTF